MLVLLVIKKMCKYLITYSASWTKTSSVNIAHLILLLNLNSKKRLIKKTMKMNAALQ